MFPILVLSIVGILMISAMKMFHNKINHLSKLDDIQRKLERLEAEHDESEDDNNLTP